MHATKHSFTKDSVSNTVNFKLEEAFLTNSPPIISATFKDAQRYVLKKRLIPPVKYNTGKKFEKKFKKPKMVDMIDCDPISVPITLNNRHGLLPWVPRNVQFQSGRNLK